jgi:hypothetical protein
LPDCRIADGCNYKLRLPILHTEQRVWGLGGGFRDLRSMGVWDLRAKHTPGSKAAYCYFLIIFVTSNIFGHMIKLQRHNSFTELKSSSNLMRVPAMTSLEEYKKFIDLLQHSFALQKELNIKTKNKKMNG